MYKKGLKTRGQAVKTIDELDLSKKEKHILQRIRETIKRTIPDAEVIFFRML